MKETVVVLFGGQSSEHVVSCMSAVNVIEQIDQGEYELVLVGITKEGRWLLVDSIEDIPRTPQTSASWCGKRNTRWRSSP